MRILISRIPARAVTVSLLAVTLALTGCTFLPSGGDAPTSTAATGQTAPNPQTSADSAESSGQKGGTASSASERPLAFPTGLFGAFGSKSEACVSVAASVAVIGLLPLGAALGGNQADIGKARETIAQMTAKVPDELKPSFGRLQDVVNRMGTDYSSFDSQAFQEDLKPITDWLDKNCNGS